MIKTTEQLICEAIENEGKTLYKVWLANKPGKAQMVVNEFKVTDVHSTYIYASDVDGEQIGCLTDRLDKVDSYINPAYTLDEKMVARLKQKIAQLAVENYEERFYKAKEKLDQMIDDFDDCLAESTLSEATKNKQPTCYKIELSHPMAHPRTLIFSHFPYMIENEIVYEIGDHRVKSRICDESDLGKIVWHRVVFVTDESEIQKAKKKLIEYETDRLDRAIYAAKEELDDFVDAMEQYL